MTYLFLLFWIGSAVCIIREQRVIRLIFLLGIFSLISSVCFLLFAAPDVAMAEAVVSAFSTIIFIVCFEKYYDLADVTAAACFFSSVHNGGCFDFSRWDSPVSAISKT